jgi:hypothetical protein
LENVDLTSKLPEEPHGAPRLPKLASSAFVAIVSGIVLWSGGPPGALPADSPADVFSAARAMRHVEAMAREPHPLGSVEEEKVRAYVLGELKALGFEPEIQKPRDARPASSRPGPESAASIKDVQNIVARWRGTGVPSKKALLLSAHYDSAQQAPGAADDASGVAAILEAIRALKTGAAPERDLIILINDGEEAGLYGAIVFADEHPWAKDVGVVLNFDARGNSGPSYMFETSERNGWLIEQLALALPHPVATSLTADIYALMGNDTDLSVYKSRGMPGLNFAFIGGLSYYHSPDDTPANLDPRTLQHQGENLLAMARHLGRLDLDQVLRPNVVYFSLLDRLVLSYPMTWATPLLQCAVLAYVVVTALGLIRRRVRITDVLVGFGAFPLAALAAIFAVGMLWFVVRRVLDAMGLPWLRFDMALLTALSLVALLVAALVFAAASRRWSWEGLGLGVLGWWLAVTAVTSLLLPGASYVFLWPLLAILAGQAASFVLPRGATIALLAAWLGATPLLILHMTILPGILQALNLSMAAPLMLLVVLAASALVPLAGQALAPRSRSA